MDTPQDHHSRTAESLRARMQMSLVLDDAMAAQLGSAAQNLDARGDGTGAEALVEAARQHRVGAIKHRAIMSAEGLDV